MRIASTQDVRGLATLSAVIALLQVCGSAPASAQTIDPAYASAYGLVALGAPGDITGAPYGGFMFASGDPNTLLISQNTDSGSAEIDSIGVIRGGGGHIIGFDSTHTFVASAYGSGGSSNPFEGIDGGLAYAPNGTMLYTSYPDNSVGEILPGATTPGTFVSLTSSGVGAAGQSVGTLEVVPRGFAGAGQLKIASFDGSTWYASTLSANSPSGPSTYSITNVNQIPTATFAPGTGPEGIAYVHGGAPLIANDSVAISEYGTGAVALYQIDANGDPIASTRTALVDNAFDVEGAAFDPVTGDLLFTASANGMDQFYEVNGFMATVPAPSSLLTLAACALPTFGLLRRRRAR